MTDCVPNARDRFWLGQTIRHVSDGRRGVVRGFTLHPGGLVVGVDGGDRHSWSVHTKSPRGIDGLPANMIAGRLTISHMNDWRPA